MGDVFKEQIVKRQATIKDTAIRVCMWVLVMLVGFFIIIAISPQIGVLVFFGLFIAARYLSGFLSVEYEYVFTSGELDIDAIYDKARRKRVFSANIKQVELMAHIDDKNHEAAFSTAQETRDYSGGTPGPNTYAFLTNHEGKKIKVIIEPNDKMLKAFSTVLTKRNLHLRPGVVLLS
jgi:hypothetical protein